MNAPPPDRIPLPLTHGGRIRSVRRAPGTPERNAANGKFSIAIAQTFTLENWRTALNIGLHPLSGSTLPNPQQPHHRRHPAPPPKRQRSTSSLPPKH
jgi:hypothetical protein